MRWHRIFARALPICLALSACGRSTNSLGELQNIDPTRYAGFESDLKSIQTDQTLAEALAEVDQHRDDVAGLKSFRMTDYGKKFWLGDGYDALTGLRAPTCFDPSLLQIQVRPLQQTLDSFDIVHNYTDLYKKLDQEFGAEIGGAWQIFTGSASFKTNIMRETRINTDDVVIIAGFSYLKDQISMYNSWPQFARFFQTVGQRSKELFRRYCGDRYTKDVSVGAGMYMVLTAKKSDSSQHNKEAVEAALKIGLASIFNVGGHTNLSNEQKQILQSYSISTKCYSAGSSADVCGAYGLNTAFDINSDTQQMQKRVTEARAKLVSEVSKGENLVAIKETLVDYETPFEACTLSGSDPCPSRWNYFVDYRPRQNKSRELSMQKGEVEEICDKADFWKRRCAKVNQELITAIQNCSNVNESCQDIGNYDLHTLQSARNPGRVRLWDNANKTGKAFEIDFDRLLTNNDKKANTFYAFHWVGLAPMNDKVSSLESQLHWAWSIRFYENADPNLSGNQWQVDGWRDIPWIGDVFGKQANDKISGFKLIPMPDL